MGRAANDKPKKKLKPPRRRSTVAAALASPLFHPRIVELKEQYRRRPKHPFPLSDDEKD